MLHGIINLSIVPVRSSPDNKSEMVNQLIFGEFFEILDEKNNWTLISHELDQYEGWIDNRMYQPISPGKYAEYQNNAPWVTTKIINIAQRADYDVPSIIVAGSSLHFFDQKSNEFENGDHAFMIFGELFKNEETGLRENIVDCAFNYLESPYLWGGRTPFGIDCSGLTQIVYKMNGIKIPRDASQQVSTGNEIPFIKEAKSGDLAFFDNDEGEIVHTGIMIGNNQIIHSSGKVRLDAIDNIGIYDKQTKKYTHKLRVIKNML